MIQGLRRLAATVVAAGFLGGGLGAQASITLGWLGPLTGDVAFWGQAELNALQMLAEERNAAGGVVVGGRSYSLKILPYDDRGDSNEAVRGAKFLVAKGVKAIIGPQGSGEAIPAAPIVNAARVPLVATTATNPLVTVDREGRVNPFVFRVCFMDDYQGRVAARFLRERRGLRRAAILSAVDDPYSVGLARAFAEAFAAEGGAVVAEETYSSGERDFRAVLSRLKAAEPEVIFLPVYYFDVALMAREARAMGMSQLLMGGDGWPSDNLIDLAGGPGGDLEGCLFVNHLDLYGESTRDFRGRFLARRGREPELNSYLASDAPLLVLEALGRAGSLDGRALAAALATADVRGISGRIRLGPTHDPEGKDAWIIRIQGARMVLEEDFVLR